MNNGELALRDIHIPDPIGWWPPAIGWWLLFLLIPISLALMFWMYKRITRKTTVKSANKLLQSIRQNPDFSDYQKLCELSILIRRTAISTYPRVETASLTGSQWLALLDRNLPDKAFSEGPGILIIDAPYQKPENKDFDIDAIFALTERWIKSLKGVKL